MFSEESYGLERNNKVLLSTNTHACPKMQAIYKVLLYTNKHACPKMQAI